MHVLEFPAGPFCGSCRNSSWRYRGPDSPSAWALACLLILAVDAAAAIHTDLAKGFIRAETVRYEDLMELGSIAEARKAGKLRSEGKTYRVRDGDVLEILFSR